MGLKFNLGFEADPRSMLQWLSRDRSCSTAVFPPISFAVPTFSGNEKSESVRGLLTLDFEEGDVDGCPSL